MSKFSFLKSNSSISSSNKNSFTSRRGSLKPKAEEMKWVFEKFDSNKDGKISVQEYKAAAKALDRGMGDAEVAKAFELMDKDGDGFIELNELMEMFGEGRMKEAEMKKAFEVFDLNGDGKISAEELSQILKRLGEGCSLSACRKMVKGVDGNGDGFIDFNEFITMMTTTNNEA
ncbi:hypothetical protein HN873_050351 [Arachis hypogaea]|uniref:EF-hand domain-containing protein n=1 Tax=Arachis hypogaea TaxID=3818 RepID=A0A444ZA61_ARAHY|nr:Calmodulin-like protein [Arachis hypogaea]RYR11065.1 hypothetical protein Ahy_B05g079552 [Arachis hypogaea]